MHTVFSDIALRTKAFGQIGQIVGKLQQRLQPVADVKVVEFLSEFRDAVSGGGIVVDHEVSSQLKTPASEARSFGKTMPFRSKGTGVFRYTFFSIGAPTKLPHSVHEPS